MPKRRKTAESLPESENLHGKPKCRRSNQNLNNVQKGSDRDNSDTNTSKKCSDHYELKWTRSCSKQKHYSTEKESEKGSCSLVDNLSTKTSQQDNGHRLDKRTRSCSKQKHYNTEKESEKGSCTLEDNSDTNTLQKDNDYREVTRTRSCSQQKLHNAEKESVLDNGTLVDKSGTKTLQKANNHLDFKWTRSCSKRKIYDVKKESEIVTCSLISQKDRNHYEVKRTRSCSEQRLYNTEKESEIDNCSLENNSGTKTLQKDSDHREFKQTRSCCKQKKYDTEESEIGTCSLISQKDSNPYEVKRTCSCSKQKLYNTEKEIQITNCSLGDNSGMKTSQKDNDHGEVKRTHSCSKQKMCNIEKESVIGNCTLEDNSSTKSSQRDSDHSQFQVKFVALEIEGIKPKLNIKKSRSRGSTRLSRKADRDRKRKRRAKMKQELPYKQINVNEYNSVCSLNSASADSKIDLYRQHKRIIEMQRYATDLQYGERKKLLGRKRYNENVVYRKKKVMYALHKYRTSNKYRNSVKTASVQRYTQDFQFRRQLKVASIKKYWCSFQYRRKKKKTSIRKYRDNIPHRENVKAASVNRYRCNPEHRQSIKAYTKLQYRQQASYRKSKKSRLRNQYKCNAVLRRKKIEKMKKQRQCQIKNIGNIVEYFKKEVRNGPKHVCCVCHKFKFQKQVLVCDVEKYKRKGRKQQQMANRCICKKYVSNCTDQCQKHFEILNHNKLWICYTCHQRLLKGEMPVDAAANNLDLQTITESLKNLNSLERQLVTLRLPFMKLVRLPKGGQNRVTGPCVSVPTDIQKTTSVLPRCEKDDQLLRVKLKRKIQYKGYYKYEYISTNKLHKGLKYLQDNNKWYSSVSLDTSWDNPIEEMPENSDSHSDAQHPAVQNSLNDPLQTDKNETNTDTEDEDQNQRDRGMPMDTCLQPADIGQEILDQYFDDIFCVAPAEGSTPVSMLRERGNEAMTFPVQYPDGSGTYDDDRPVPLTRTIYFHSRLLHADSRFASDSNYLFYAQYLSELEQVISKVSIALRKGSAKDHSGNSLSVEVLSDPSKLKNLFKTDQGYKFLTPIRSTPPYWQATLKDLFAMIRQLGIPTWFCTFSAADMRWTEVLEVLLKQQGVPSHQMTLTGWKSVRS